MRKIVIFLDYFYINWVNSNCRVVNKVIKLIKIFKGVLLSFLEKVVESICFERFKFLILRL